MIKTGVANAMVMTDDIEHLPSEVLDSLNVGDVIIKVTGKQKHLYQVTYKGDGVGEGICMSYFACGYLETISYDLTENGWAYNSKDVWQAQE